MISLYVNALLYTLQYTVIHPELTPLSCVACMAKCCSVHKSALTYKEIIFGTFSNQQVLCICICLISCTESETYAHVGLRDGGPIFRAPFEYAAILRQLLWHFCYAVCRDYFYRRIGYLIQLNLLLCWKLSVLKCRRLCCYFSLLVDDFHLIKPNNNHYSKMVSGSSFMIHLARFNFYGIYLFVSAELHKYPPSRQTQHFIISFNATCFDRQRSSSDLANSNILLRFLMFCRGRFMLIETCSVVQNIKTLC